MSALPLYNMVGQITIRRISRYISQRKYQGLYTYIIVIQRQGRFLDTRMTESKMVVTELYLLSGLHAMGQKYLTKVIQMVRSIGHIV